MTTTYYDTPVDNNDDNDNDTENDTEIDAESEAELDNTSVASGVTQNRLTRQQVTAAIKLADPGYNIIRKPSGIKPNGRNKFVKIEMYSTHSNPGYHIRHPVHGYRYTETVGSRAEHGFFKVRNVSIGDGTNLITLYYDSPEAYEAHQRTTVPFEVKRAWKEKKKRHGF